MKTERWRGKSSAGQELWRKHARKIKTLSQRRSYSGGGLPRIRDKVKPVSLPRLKFMEGDAP